MKKQKSAYTLVLIKESDKDVFQAYVLNNKFSVIEQLGDAFNSKGDHTNEVNDAKSKYKITGSVMNDLYISTEANLEDFIVKLKEAKANPLVGYSPLRISHS